MSELLAIIIIVIVVASASLFINWLVNPWIKKYL